MSDDDSQKLDELHRFLMQPRAPGKVSRAQELDDLLASVRTGKTSVRAFLWLCGVIVAVGAVVAQLKGWMGR